MEEAAFRVLISEPTMPSWGNHLTLWQHLLVAINQLSWSTIEAIQLSIMATGIFVVLVFLVGIIVLYINLRDGHSWQRLSNIHTLLWVTKSQYITSDKEQTFPAVLQPYQLPPLRIRASSCMVMGLKRLDASNWLTIDNAYLPEHTLRSHMLQYSRPNVLQCLPGTEAVCHEVLDLVTSFLSRRFPEHFTINHSTSVIHNHLTKESYIIGPQCLNPMETAARLAMEDFNILEKDPKTGEYLIKASATLFPAGWQLQEKIGTSIANLHSPVPGWQANLGAAVNKYFDHLSSRTYMERYNLFLQTTTNLFQDGPEAPPPSPLTLRSEHITVRRERQTFMRLEKTGAVLFTVRTYMQPLTDLTGVEVEGLMSQIQGWDREMKSYKGWDHWGKVVEDWCESKLAKLRRNETLVEGSILRERKLSV